MQHCSRSGGVTSATMVALIFLFFNLVASFFKSKSRLEAENAAMQHQLTVLPLLMLGFALPEIGREPPATVCAPLVVSLPWRVTARCQSSTRTSRHDGAPYR